MLSVRNIELWGVQKYYCGIKAKLYCHASKSWRDKLHLVAKVAEGIIRCGSFRAGPARSLGPAQGALLLRVAEYLKLRRESDNPLLMHMLE